MSTLGFETHDHGACVDDAMAAAPLGPMTFWGICPPKGLARSPLSPIAHWIFW